MESLLRLLGRPFRPPHGTGVSYLCCSSPHSLCFACLSLSLSLRVFPPLCVCAVCVLCVCFAYCVRVNKCARLLVPFPVVSVCVLWAYLCLYLFLCLLFLFFPMCVCFLCVSECVCVCFVSISVTLPVFFPCPFLCASNESLEHDSQHQARRLTPVLLNLRNEILIFSFLICSVR